MDKLNMIVLGDGFMANGFKRHGYEVYGRGHYNYSSDGLVFYDTLRDRVIEADGDLVLVNTVGVSDTRYCEDRANWHDVFAINSAMATELSQIAKEYNFKLVHVSTGCLYDIKEIPQKEDDFISAHCNYTLSKWIAEIGMDLDRDLIIRPRLLFDSEPPKDGKRNNLLCKLLTFDSFLDEYNTVTSNNTIVEAVEALLEANQVGVFNVGNLGKYTIADIAEAIGLDTTHLTYAEDLCRSQKLYLVNNIMDMTKLRQFYEPRDALVEVKRCYEILKGHLPE